MAENAAKVGHPALAIDLAIATFAIACCVERHELLPALVRWTLLLLPRRGLRNVHLLAVFQRVRRVDDDLVADREAAQNLQRGAVIAADVEGAQLHLVVGADDGDPRALGAEEHGVDRNRELLHVGADREVHLAEGAGQQAPILVGHIDFGEQGAGRRVDGLGGARHHAGELLAGKLLQGDVALDADLDVRRVGLGNAGEDAQGIDLGHVEELACRRLRH